MKKFINISAVFMKYLSAVLLLCVLYSNAFAQNVKDPSNLRINLKQGKSYKINFESTSKSTAHAMQQTSVSTMNDSRVILLNVIGSEEDRFTLEYSLISQKRRETSDGITKVFDSENPNTGDPKFSKQYKLEKDNPLSLVIDNQGNILETQGFDKFLNKEGVAEDDPIAKAFGNTGMLDMLKKVYWCYPKENHKIGDTWQEEFDVPHPLMPINVSCTGKLISDEKDSIKIEVDVQSKSLVNNPGFTSNESTMKIDVKQGTMKIVSEFDKLTGWLKESRIEDMLDSDFTISAKGFSLNVPSIVESTLTLKSTLVK